MIIKRLFELAEREGLLEDPAFEAKPVRFVINIAQDGGYLGIVGLIGAIETLGGSMPDKVYESALRGRSRGRRPSGKQKANKGKELSVPRAHGNTANPGFACYFADTLARVLPVSDEAKSISSRKTFWKQLAEAENQTGDLSLRALIIFWDCLQSDEALAARVREDVNALMPSAPDAQEHDPDKYRKFVEGNRCTFAWHPDGGATIIEREAVRAWFRVFYSSLVSSRQGSGRRALCQISRQVEPLPTTHPTKIPDIPGGMSMGVSLISYDKPAYQSYRLEGTENAGLGQRAADGYTRALVALVRNKLPGRARTNLKVGDTMFLFWTRDPTRADDWLQLDNPETDQVEALIASVGTGRERTITVHDFYGLCLSASGARAVVRDYLEAPLPVVRENLGRWFRDLKIIDPDEGRSRADFPLWRLAGTTVRRGDKLPLGLPATLMSAALGGLPVPVHILAACLQRMRVEEAAIKFSAARMALLKLILCRITDQEGVPMTEALDQALVDRSDGYASGRLLALLARCQSPRDFGSGAQILDRYYGSASTAPRAVFPILLRLNRHHLRKIRDENPGFAFNLDMELEERLAPFRMSAEGDPDFPAVLSLTEQGRFAMGFYHQRAEYRRTKTDNTNPEAVASTG